MLILSDDPLINLTGIELVDVDVDEKVLIFNKAVLNIRSNFIPPKVIVCDDKDPPWFNGKLNG